MTFTKGELPWEVWCHERGTDLRKGLEAWAVTDIKRGVFVLCTWKITMQFWQANNRRSRGGYSFWGVAGDDEDSWGSSTLSAPIKLLKSFCWASRSVGFGWFRFNSPSLQKKNKSILRLKLEHKATKKFSIQKNALLQKQPLISGLFVTTFFNNLHE